MWSHAPFHFTAADGIYMITSGTCQKRHFYEAPADLDLLQSQLFAIAKEHSIVLHAWCLLVNHYHLVVDAMSGTIQPFIRHLHSVAAIELNRRQGAPGRKVWFQYFDTMITSQRSYFARLKYVHENAVHHGVAMNAMNYRWCSASWFVDQAPRGFVRAVCDASLNHVSVPDEY